MSPCTSRSALIPDDELEKCFDEMSEQHALTVAMVRRHIAEQRAELAVLVAALERVQHWADSQDGSMPACPVCREVANAHMPDCELGQVLRSPAAEHGRRWLEAMERQVSEQEGHADEVLTPRVKWQSGQLRVVRDGAEPPRLEVFDGPDGEAPGWYAPALPWATEPAVSALVHELTYALAAEGGRK